MRKKIHLISNHLLVIHDMSKKFSAVNRRSTNKNDLRSIRLLAIHDMTRYFLTVESKCASNTDNGIVSTTNSKYYEK